MEDVAHPRCAHCSGRRVHAPQPLTRQAAKREMWWSVVQAREAGARMEAACALEPPEGSSADSHTTIVPPPCPPWHVWTVGPPDTS